MSLNRRQRDAADETALALAKIDPSDAEVAHGAADKLLLDFIMQIGTAQTDSIVLAYRDLVARAPFWATA